MTAFVACTLQCNPEYLWRRENKRIGPWEHAINGCASVIGTVLSIIIAMTYGFSAVTVLAVPIYVIGVLAMFRAHKGTGENRVES